ncbi:hypothetical protein Hdeb2414_s0009g00323461 [Helianthus debilis subsp. tardiflorus]
MNHVDDPETSDGLVNQVKHELEVLPVMIHHQVQPQGRPDGSLGLGG